MKCGIMRASEKSRLTRAQRARLINFKFFEVLEIVLMLNFP